MKQTQRDRVKRYLLDHGSITNVEAVNMRILRLSERIRELQETGMQIESTREGHGVWRYNLLNRPVKKVAVYSPNGVIFVPEELARAQGMEILD
jgi:hypothetical protein